MFTMSEAFEMVLRGVRDGLRGTGCVEIRMCDGRLFGVAKTLSRHGVDLVEQYSETSGVVCRVHPSEVQGEVEAVEWTCDEGGSLYC